MKTLALVTLGLVGLVIPSPAAGGTTRETFPIDFTLTECGTTIHVTGDVLSIVTLTENASGGAVFALHLQPQNVSGTDELGRLYRGTGLTRDMSVATPPGGSTFTFINRFHIVGTMGAPTFSISETYHVTVTPSGQIVALVDNVSVECV